MAKQIADFDFTRRGRKEKYPWAEWLEVGTTWELTHGEGENDEDVDYTCTSESLRTTIYSAAKKYGVSVATQISEDRVVIAASELVEVDPQDEGEVNEYVETAVEASEPAPFASI